MINASKAIEEANSYPEIRLFTAYQIESSTPLYELKEVKQPWSVASAGKKLYLPWRISFAKSYISIFYRNRTNTNCWGMDPSSNENLHEWIFQMFWRTLENKQQQHLPCILKAFFLLSNFQICLHSLMEIQKVFKYQLLLFLKKLSMVVPGTISQLFVGFMVKTFMTTLKDLLD